MKLKDIRLNPDNPRVIRDEKFQKLKRSIEEFPKMMSLRPIVIDADGVVLGGNMRLRALQDLGYKEVPDEWVRRAEELTDDEKRRFVIADNVGFGEWAWDALANEWDAEDLEAWGLDLPEFIEEIKEAEDDGFEMPDEVHTDIVPGDLFEIGPHRLLCGDSTNADDVPKLLGGKKPLLMVTDPPYGVEYDPEWRKEAGINKNAAKMGKVSNDSRADWREAWSIAPASVAYVWHAGRYASIVAESLEVCDFEIRNQIIWAKDKFALSRGAYHWQHEPCWYAVRKGATANWSGDRKQSTLWQIDNMHATQGKVDDGKTKHGTQKPVECMRRPIENHTKPGDAVYEPFSGSGTTIIACELTERACYAIELNPLYVDMAVRRWQNFTGQQAINEATGKPF